MWIHSGGAIPVAVPEALAQSKLGLVIWPHFQKHASLFRGRLSPKGAGWELTRTSLGKQLLGERLRILCVAWGVCRVRRGSPKALL